MMTAIKLTLAVVLAPGVSSVTAERYFDLSRVQTDALVLMCTEIDVLSLGDYPSVDPLAFMKQHENALNPEFLKEYVEGVERAKQGLAALVRGYVIEPEDMIEKALPAALAVIKMGYCDPASVNGIYCPVRGQERYPRCDGKS